MQNSQVCGICLKPYDYFQHSITMVCGQNHLACRKCVGEMIQTQSKCPFCLQPVLNPNQQIGTGWNANQNLGQPQAPVQPQPYAYNPYWQPIPANNLNQNVANNQGFNAQPYVMPANVGVQSSPGKFCGISLVFLVAAVVLLIIRIQMNSCYYWGVNDCGYYYSKYCCTSTCYNYPDTSCHYLTYYQNFGQMILATVGIAVFGSLSFVFLGVYLRRRKLASLANNYAVMAN